MKFVILGANGSMGKRYQSILKYLDHDYDLFDIGSSMDEIFLASDNSDGVIIATPTGTHAAYIQLLAVNTQAPLLCEKPVTKDLTDLDYLIDTLTEYQTNFTMMLQYSMLDSHQEGPSYYNYFRTGNDGLVWDCFQTIALARGSVEVANNSPIWTCMLNGKMLDLGQMDKAYVEFVRSWIESPGEDLNFIRTMHHKVKDYELGKRQ